MWQFNRRTRADGVSAGLRVQAALDGNPYAQGTNVADVDVQHVNLEPARFHSDWNYTVSPHRDS